MSNSTDTKEYRLPIRRPVTTAMIFLSLVVFGMKSYQDLALNLMPDISYPTLTVRTEYEGGAPEDIEKLVTRPLEETLSIVGGMVEISSTSAPGVSEVVLEFTWDSDMNVAQQEVRDRLDLYDPPEEVTEKPIILRFDPTLDPIFRVAILGPPLEEFPGDRVEQERRYAEYLAEVREAAERHLKGDLEGEIGIAQVNVKGGREKEIEVQVDTGRLTNLGLSLAAVNSALAQQNINLSGGSLKEGKTEFLVRTLNEYQDVGEIQQTIVGRPDGRPLRLADVATVRMGEKDRETIIRINGREAVELEIFKDGDANTVEVANRLKRLLGVGDPGMTFTRMVQQFQARQRGEELTIEELEQRELAQTMQSRLPDNVDMRIISDQSRFIVGAIREVQNTAIVGGFLALFILYAFLRDMRSTAIIGVAIPISVIATFIPMFMGDISLNIMSLGGLALGIGMLVDNSIVVLESIFRCREEGDGLVDAAERGTGEVGAAVTASTLTTIAVFLPIAFVEGVAGQLFRDQALTVAFSLVASLLVALYLIPMIASRGSLAMLRGEGSIWMVRAYREARETGNEGRLRAVVSTFPIALRNEWAWLKDMTRRTFDPVAGPWDDPEAGLFKQLMTIPIAPFMAVVLVMTVGLHYGGQILATMLFGFLLFFGALFYGLWKLTKLVLWLPLKAFDAAFETLRIFYDRLIRVALQFGPVLMLLVAGLAWHSFTLAGELGQELIPPMKQGEFGIRMEAPPGTPLLQTAGQAAAIERLALEEPLVRTVAVQIGEESTRAGGDQGENIARFTVLMDDPDRTTPLQDDLMERLRFEVAEITSNDVTFTLPKLFSFKNAIELQVRGDNLYQLREVGRAALERVQGIAGLRDAELSIKEGYPEIIIELDRELLWTYGLSAEDVAQQLRASVQGDVATRFNEEGFKIDVRVRTAEDKLASLQDLRMLNVNDGNPPLPLYRVASRLDIREGPSEIRRIDQRQVALLTGNVEGRDLAAVTEEMMRAVEDLPRPDDYEILAGGQNRELETSYRSLIFALGLAVFLVYVVMASQFESMLHPALVMFSVPLAGIGVIYALDWMAIDLSIVVFIGAITLAGIVVNNAIVLVDYINQLRGRGMPKREAVIEAGKVRLRPILMTTMTTVLGLAPMAAYAGEGAEIRQPMAVTIIAGLLSSTFLTLVVIPTVYDLFGGKDKPAET